MTIVERDNRKGLIFDIKKFYTDDGPSIRTTIFIKVVLYIVYGVIVRSLLKKKKNYYYLRINVSGACVV